MENYARFGARILSSAQAVVDKIEQATDQQEASSFG